LSGCSRSATSAAGQAAVIEYALVFASMLALDYVYAKYTQAAAHHKPTAAGLWASGILPLNYVVITGYLDNPWMLLPAVAGAFCGTWYATKKAP